MFFLLLQLIYMGFKFKFLIFKKLPLPVIADIVYISSCCDSFSSFRCLCKLLLLYISECIFHEMILLILEFPKDTYKSAYNLVFGCQYKHNDDYSYTYI
jgi:hypothetical protein